MMQGLELDFATHFRKSGCEIGALWGKKTGVPRRGAGIGKRNPWGDLVGTREADDAAAARTAALRDVIVIVVIDEDERSA